MLTLILIAVIGAVSGFIGSVISGATTSLAVPLMIATGVPPQLAIANRQFGILAWRLGGLRHFHKANKILWRYVAPLAVVGSIGALFGTKLLVSVDGELLQLGAGIVSLLMLPALYLDKKRGVRVKQPSKLSIYSGYIFYGVVSAFGSFLAVGAGVAMTYLYLYSFGMTLLELKGTDRVAGLFPNIVTVIALIAFGVFSFWQAAALAVGMFVGASFGARYALKIGDERLRAFTFVSIALASCILIGQYFIK